jgi:hypothetical protein
VLDKAIKTLGEKEEDALTFLALCEAVDQSSDSDIASLTEQIPVLKETLMNHIDAAKLAAAKVKNYLSSK